MVDQVARVQVVVDQVAGSSGGGSSGGSAGSGSSGGSAGSGGSSGGEFRWWIKWRECR